MSSLRCRRRYNLHLHLYIPSSVLLSLIFLLAWDAPREIRFIHHRRGGSHRSSFGGLGARSAVDRVNYFHDSVQRARFIVCHHFRRAPPPLHHRHHHHTLLHLIPLRLRLILPPPSSSSSSSFSFSCLLRSTLHSSRGGTRPSPDLLRRRRLEMPRYTQPNTQLSLAH